MAVRTITATITNYQPNILTSGDDMQFTVTSDTGPVSASGVEVYAAMMELSSICTYVDDCELLVRFDSPSANAVATAGPLSMNNYNHSQTNALANRSTTLLTASPNDIYLVVSYNDAAQVVSFLDGCTVRLDIYYAGACTPPGNVQLSVPYSNGNAVALTWNAGAGGVGNEFRYYEVARQSSTDGVTWSGWESIAQTTSTYAVVEPPATVGHYYKYYVRTVGSAGDAQASGWAGAPTLQRIVITRCGMPENVNLPASESSGSVRMTWTAGSSGMSNYVSYYEVVRRLSTDGGSTWGSLENVGTTTGLYMWVEPPATTGHIYKYLIRTVGSAGVDHASYWVECSKTLKKVKAALVEYTDPIIMAGVTRVKAVHITELQTNANLVRAAANLAAYEFTAIRAGYTGLNGWNAHIEELRAAIDGLGIAHEEWLALGVNCPRADVLMQLRNVVEAMA